MSENDALLGAETTVSYEKALDAEVGEPLALVESAALRTGLSILGADSQILEVVLPPGKSLTAEPGLMVHIGEGVHPELTVPSPGDYCQRWCCVPSESLETVTWTNHAEVPRSIGIAPSIPSRVIPIDLDTMKDVRIKPGSFIAIEGRDVDISKACAKSPVSAIRGGQGMWFNSIAGEGMAFIHAAGAVLTKKLAKDEKIVVDVKHALAWESSVSVSYYLTKGGPSMWLWGSETFHNTQFTGPGTVWIQSMSFEQMAQAINNKDERVRVNADNVGANSRKIKKTSKKMQ